MDAEALRLGFVAGMAVAAAWDAWCGRIPNALTLPLGVAGLAGALYLRGWSGLGWAALGAALPLVLLLPAVAAGWLGGGDAKLLAAAGAWLGPVGVLGVAVLGALVGGVLALAYLLGRAHQEGWAGLALAHPEGFLRLARARFGREPIPYGPALAAAAVLWAMRGEQILARALAGL